MNIPTSKLLDKRYEWLLIYYEQSSSLLVQQSTVFIFIVCLISTDDSVVKKVLEQKRCTQAPTLDNTTRKYFLFIFTPIALLAYFGAEDNAEMQLRKQQKFLEYIMDAKFKQKPIDINHSLFIT